jgi:hypothetical protein
MPLKRSQAVPFVAKEVCRRPYTFENESVSHRNPTIKPVTRPVLSCFERAPL